MGFQLSPGVNVSEIDLTTVVPSVLTTSGAFAGYFRWGPIDKVVLVDSEITLSKIFGKPDANSATSFFTSSNFLSYGNNLSVVRSVGANSENSIINASSPPLKINNSDVFELSFLHTNTLGAYGPFIGRYPGTLGNSLSVYACDAGGDFSNWAYKNYFPSAPGTSDQCSAAGGSNDEIHIAVIDAGGLFTIPLKYGKSGIISVKLNVEADNKYSASTTPPFAVLVR